mmetsp:Transcript_34760/g.107558  ORF Transcript_34760/g.107558 Transcript_34760/m.107558 type:complete len:393 (-) Transcript_34760:178-1356(-)
MSRISTAVPPRRAARIAASFTTAAKSAPTNPLVSLATAPRSTFDETATFFAWTRRIDSRPSRSGGGTLTTRSKRPGRTSAGSKMLRRFVAARTTTPLFASTPSMHANNWLSVCSTSSFAPPSEKLFSRRRRPSASISSMKTTHGASDLARSKSCRTRAAPRPTNISTNSEPEHERNGARADVASARANNVLPVPGGPTSNTPRGGRAPSAAYARADAPDVSATSSATSRFAASMPATLSNVTGSPVSSNARARRVRRLAPTDPTPPPIICRATRPSAARYPNAMSHATPWASDALGRARRHSTPADINRCASAELSSAGTAKVRLPSSTKSYRPAPTTRSATAPRRSSAFRNCDHWISAAISTGLGGRSARAKSAAAAHAATAVSLRPRSVA